MQQQNKQKQKIFLSFHFHHEFKSNNQRITVVVQNTVVYWNHSPIALLAVFRAAFRRSLVIVSLNPNQVIKARFGARTHLVFCTFAFFTNLIVMMSLTVAGTAVLNRYYP